MQTNLFVLADCILWPPSSAGMVRLDWQFILFFFQRPISALQLRFLNLWLRRLIGLRRCIIIVKVWNHETMPYTRPADRSSGHITIVMNNLKSYIHMYLLYLDYIHHHLLLGSYCPFSDHVDNENKIKFIASLPIKIVSLANLSSWGNAHLGSAEFVCFSGFL